MKFSIPLFLLLRSSRGLSLSEVTVGMGIAAVVALGSAAMLTQGAKVSQLISVQSDLNNEHTLALQALRDKEKVSAALGIAEGSPLGDCLSGRGENCQIFSRTGSQTVKMKTYPPSPKALNGVEAFDQTVTAQIFCSNVRCTHIELSVDTRLDDDFAKAKNAVAAPKVSQILLPGGMLFSRAPVDFQCGAGGSMVTGVNFENLEGQCKAIEIESECSGSSPLGNYGTTGSTCQTMENETCDSSSSRFGFARLGVFQPQSSCRAPAVAEFEVVNFETEFPIPLECNGKSNGTIVLECGETLNCSVPAMGGGKFEPIGCNAQATGNPCRGRLTDDPNWKDQGGKFTYTWTNSPATNGNAGDAPQSFYVANENGDNSGRMNVIIKSCKGGEKPKPEVKEPPKFPDSGTCDGGKKAKWVLNRDFWGAAQSAEMSCADLVANVSCGAGDVGKQVACCVGSGPCNSTNAGGSCVTCESPPEKKCEWFSQTWEWVDNGFDPSYTGPGTRYSSWAPIITGTGKTCTASEEGTRRSAAYAGPPGKKPPEQAFFGEICSCSTPTDTAIIEENPGDCTVMHPIGYFVAAPGRGTTCHCAEWFAPPGSPQPTSTWKNGVQTELGFNYCVIHTNGSGIQYGYGDAVFKCENGGLKQISGTCNEGHRP